MSIILAGIALGFSLIISIGPQNIFLIKQGIKRESITAVILVCILSDVVLYIIAVSGVGVLVEQAPVVLEILRWVGVTYLGWFAIQAFKDAFKRAEHSVSVVDDQKPTTNGSATVGAGSSVALKTAQSTRSKIRHRLHTPVATALILTWVNPNTWVDAVVIGGIAAQYGDPGRWLFIVGTMITSLIWFPLVGYGAGALSKPLSNPRVWRVLNVGIGLILTGLTFKLALM
ncbi:LysE/ArgO family amino acid transporter [Corynebacterium lubricantis]|uniref:LysE/ArgO family amino acid transporter n=1 Tax=Corynebacterium lubricantis TaxID=541095 RepID=UPI000683E632|nr:LysE/ArgO family amino acid transporter [Corynebacterium lubricantis]